jgi:hypothetical protein
MTRAESLKDLTSRLKHLNTLNDPEVAHSKADKILIEALYLLTKHDPELAKPGKALIQAFHRVEKWYV